MSQKQSQPKFLVCTPRSYLQQLQPKAGIWVPLRVSRVGFCTDATSSSASRPYQRRRLHNCKLSLRIPPKKASMCLVPTRPSQNWEMVTLSSTCPLSWKEASWVSSTTPATRLMGVASSTSPADHQPCKLCPVIPFRSPTLPFPTPLCPPSNPSPLLQPPHITCAPGYPCNHHAPPMSYRTALMCITSSPWDSQLNTQQLWPREHLHGSTQFSCLT